LKIAILGSRGIPANYGGFETFAEELSARLVKKGHNVTVYCCSPYSKNREKLYKGINRVVLPTIRHKILEKPLFNLLSLLHVAFTTTDVILMLGVSVSPFCFIPRIFGKKIAINIDGLEWQRKKWGEVVSMYLKFAERVTGITANCVITDALWIKNYYKKKYKKESVYIPYGADIATNSQDDTLKKYGLKPDEYILYVGRFEPENNALMVREVFDEIENPSRKLVMVGDAPFSKSYIQKVKDTKNKNIIFTGNLYGKSYKELMSHAYFYIQASEVGGTHITLLDAMAADKCILANDVPEHREVLREAGVYYKGKEEMKKRMLELLHNGKIITSIKMSAVKIIDQKYSWDSVADQYEQLFETMTKQTP
jgi:glycosyltransferase involved in cell wall biosynthesis